MWFIEAKGEDKLDKVMIRATRFIRGFRVWRSLEAPSQDRKVLGNSLALVLGFCWFFSPELKSNRSSIGDVGKRRLRYSLEKNHHSISRSQGMRL